MIYETSKINQPIFNAKLKLHKDTVVKDSVYREFAERTKKYPNLILSQEFITPFCDDIFYLRHKTKNNVLMIDSSRYTCNLPQTPAAAVNRLVYIFNKIMDKARKKGVIYG